MLTGALLILVAHVRKSTGYVIFDPQSEATTVGLVYQLLHVLRLLSLDKILSASSGKKRRTFVESKDEYPCRLGMYTACNAPTQASYSDSTWLVSRFELGPRYSVWSSVYG